ncbi:helix-turn-helix domain-containing protein [Nocardia sp. NPDC058705]|uniref:helix-turn-helix domain-containing protein n=1 Tax=Nocardia sp. NPDC058705 TaxID=3346609 RepID=UPI0036CD5A11
MRQWTAVRSCPCRRRMSHFSMMSRHTTFRYCLDPTVEQSVMLARHAGAARCAFNQSLHFAKSALAKRKIGPESPVPWTRFDLINAFNTWKKSEAWPLRHPNCTRLAATMHGKAAMMGVGSESIAG